MNPELPEAHEQEQLDRLARELRSAYPEAELSTGFHEALQARLHYSWSFRAALRRNGLMRVAAGLLMISLVAAPVAAVVQLLKAPPKEPPTLGFTLPEGLDQDFQAEDESLLPSNIVGPEDEFDARTDWATEPGDLLEQRLRTLTASMPRIPSLPQTLDPDHDPLLSLQLAVSEGPRLTTAEIEARIVQLEGLEAPSPAAKTALAGWRWLLHGEETASAEAPEAWNGAPFVRD